MLCVDCGIRPVIYRRTRCLECQSEHQPTPQMKRWPYCREDHAGKRERLRAAIAEAIQSGAIVVTGGRG